MKHKNSLDIIALILVIIGGLNWGLVGLFKFDLVKYIFTTLISVPLITDIVYILVGVSALYMIYGLLKD